MQAFVEGYGYKLTSTSILPQQCSTLHLGIAIKDSPTSLAFPLQEDSPHISKLKLQSLLSTQRSPTQSCTASTSKNQYYLPSELLTIKNHEFTEFVEGPVKVDIVADFCENLDPTKFEVKLLGGRLIDSVGSNVSTLMSDEPTTFEIAENKPNFEQFCETICIQVNYCI